MYLLPLITLVFLLLTLAVIAFAQHLGHQTLKPQRVLFLPRHPRSRRNLDPYAEPEQRARFRFVWPALKTKGFPLAMIASTVTVRQNALPLNRVRLRTTTNGN
jgi:hypothetical protein